MFRNPGHAKLATTLDHVSSGRAVLGIGGAWFEREHDGFGIDFGASVGERLDRLDESVMLLRRLLDGERFSHEGRFYTFHDALCAPRPIQAHLPILIGGSGPRKTLRTVALRGDAWNTAGTVEEVRGRLEILGEHCAAVGGDIATIEKTLSFPIILRDDRAAADAAYGALMAANGIEDMERSTPSSVPRLRWPTRYGRTSSWASRPSHPDAGPYDRETIDRGTRRRAARRVTGERHGPGRGTGARNWRTASGGPGTRRADHHQHRRRHRTTGLLVMPDRRGHVHAGQPPTTIGAGASSET
jgi:alkanesulfonate monooxygenase SsuD/methylene tetrahydromethanopterin reductase-like flavin-dependent oxidoreductase (luciferase family)